MLRKDWLTNKLIPNNIILNSFNIDNKLFNNIYMSYVKSRDNKVWLDREEFRLILIKLLIQVYYNYIKKDYKVIYYYHMTLGLTPYKNKINIIINILLDEKSLDQFDLNINRKKFIIEEKILKGYDA